MGLGSTAKKIQTVADRAEQLYKQLVDVRQRVMELEKTTTDTGDRVRDLETDLEKQRAILDALAEERGIDVDQVLADAAIENVDESDGSTAGDDAVAESEAAEDGETAEATDGDATGESTGAVNDGGTVANEETENANQ